MAVEVESLTCIGVIPARGGSKRIPRKNIRQFQGKPLIAYTIEAALKSRLFDSVVVSTDDSEIAGIATECGASVPFFRSSSLADDETPVSAATADVLDRLDPTGKKFAGVAQLMANCPLRTATDILDSYRQFVATGAHSQISVTSYGWLNPWWAMRQAKNHVLEPVFAREATTRSQDLPRLLCPTGAVWWARCSILRRERTFHIKGRSGWEIPWQHGVDIDTEEDWKLAEILFEKRRADH